MLLEHRGKGPRIHESAYVAPTAVICGDVTIGENCQILFGAVLVAEGGPVVIGCNCIITVSYTHLTLPTILLV